MLLFPLGVDVPMQRLPWMNWLLMLVIVVCHVLSSVDPELTLPFILGIDGEVVPIALFTRITVDESPLSWIGHMFLHGGFWHLAGNLIFMWAFGNAVCAKIGNIVYAVAWIGLGLLAALAHVVTTGGPMLGASGAINGIVGMFLILYPINEITMFYFVFLLVRVFTGTFALASYWMILLWFAFDVLGFVTKGEDVAYAAHVGGFVGGAALALGLLAVKLLESDEHECNLLEVIAERRGGARAKKSKTGRRRLSADKPSPALMARRLHVRLAGGQLKELPVIEFLRHEGQGKEVNHFVVSEDGANWTTFGDWRKRNRT